MSKAADDARTAIDKVLDNKIDEDLLNTLFENVLSLEKSARGWCPSCKKAVNVTINDAKAVVSALNELLVQAKGRPGQAEQEQEKSIVFENRIFFGLEGCEGD